MLEATRQFGVELEMGDLLLVPFAHAVQRFCGKTEDEWQDRWGHGIKIHRYDQWYVTSDGTLLNSNGTRLMWNYMGDDGEIHTANSSKGGDRSKWQGAELVSPVWRYSSINEFEEEIGQLIGLAKGQGAVFSPELRHTTHVHVSIEDFDLRMVKQLLRLAKSEAVFMEREFLGEHKYPVRWLKNVNMEAIDNAETVEELFEAYRIMGDPEKIPEPHNFAWRKVVNPGPWFKWKLGEEDAVPTVEFRIFPSTDSAHQIRQWVDWCVDFVERAKHV